MLSLPSISSLSHQDDGCCFVLTNSGTNHLQRTTMMQSLVSSTVFSPPVSPSTCRPSLSQRNRSSSVIRFDANVQVHHVPRINDPGDAWYSYEDYKQIKQREKRLEKKVTASIRKQSIVRQVLGLETKHEKIVRYSRARNVQSTVLHEQRFVDSEALAQVCKEISYQCAVDARHRGLNVECVLQNPQLSDREVEEQDEASHTSVKHRRWSATGSSSSTDCSPTNRTSSSAYKKAEHRDYQPNSDIQHRLTAAKPKSAMAIAA
jgi:hypothetical protein